MDFTVAICTFNGAKRIPEVLELLKLQSNPDSIGWEVLVINNNSTDETATIVAQYAQNWRSDSQFRCVLEKVQGVAAARQRAVEEARSNLIGFLDDDNLPEQNWLTEAYRFAQKNPQAGLYGGIIHLKLDNPPPPYFKQIKHLLAINNPGSKAFCYRRDAKPRQVPAGAGVVVRKAAWLEYVPARLHCQGRGESQRKISGCGEDTEAFYHIQNSPWEIWHNPKMEICHHLESRRLEPNYLLQLAYGFGLANYVFRLTRLWPWQRPFMLFLVPLFLTSDSYKVVSYYLRYHNQFTNDIGKACEFQGRMGRLMSVFWYHFS